MHMYRYMYIYLVYIILYTGRDTNLTTCVKYLLLEYFTFSGLGVAKVHYFIQQFIEQNKIIPDTFFLKLLKVLTKYLV